MTTEHEHEHIDDFLRRLRVENDQRKSEEAECRVKHAVDIVDAGKAINIDREEDGRSYIAAVVGFLIARGVPEGPAWTFAHEACFPDLDLDPDAVA